MMKLVRFVLHVATISGLMLAAGGFGMLIVAAFERWVR